MNTVWQFLVALTLGSVLAVAPSGTSEQDQLPQPNPPLPEGVLARFSSPGEMVARRVGVCDWDGPLKRG